jgi:hypothetical protein
MGQSSRKNHAKCGQLNCKHKSSADDAEWHCVHFVSGRETARAKKNRTTFGAAGEAKRLLIVGSAARELD